MRFAVILLLMAGPVYAQAPSQQQSCVDVKVGTARSYDCMNEQFRAMAQQGHTAQQTPPMGANSPPNQTGQFDESATRNRLGTNFGKSVTPERPTGQYGRAFIPPRSLNASE